MRRRGRHPRLRAGRWLVASAVLLVASGGTAQSIAQSMVGARGATQSVSGLPLPRFVSLKSDRVNLRNGPGTDYPTAWVLRRAGMPLEVIKEFEGWRQVRDAEGTTGWVVQSFLSGRRTALVLPWEIKPDKALPHVTIRASDSNSARAVAAVEAGVIASVLSCDGRWCLVVVDAYRGYLEQEKLWGVYPREIVK